MTTWNERIRQRREELGLSQAELARRVGVRPPTVFEWEDGTIKQLRAANLMKLSAELGVLPNWIQTGKGARTAGDLSAGAMEFAALYEQCPVEHRETLTASTRALVRGMVADQKEELLARKKKSPRESKNEKRSLPVDS